ncbi:Retrovirus-related Pol polyprotein from transposon opus [Vitis vinifera]|uniref:Retrovirus-related Pol polyprotein from transposon opus n=1 Tax=Vitis vinifera TaxID=29760 RepID=A0A438FVR9_VITVI|nr:Retrovirus-related Pol polyprotein from transposon opus [Vitis vinifera]
MASLKDAILGLGQNIDGVPALPVPIQGTTPHDSSTPPTPPPSGPTIQPDYIVLPPPPPPVQSAPQALYGIEEGISRGLWADSSPSDLKGKKLGSGPMPLDVGTIVLLPPLRGIHLIEHMEGDVFMMGWDGEAPQPISLYEDLDLSGYTHQQQLLGRRFTTLEDDEILCQLCTTQARISIWSLLASSSTHRDALIRALNHIRVDTTTTLEGLIHLLIADKAMCIVFSDDDLPPEGSDHVQPLFIDVACSGHRVSSILLDNDFALNVCPLVIAIALGFSPSNFGPSTQTIITYDGTQRTVMGTLTTHIMIRPVRYFVLLQMYLGIGIPETPDVMIVAPSSLDRASMFSICFPEVVFYYDILMDTTIDDEGVTLPDVCTHKMDTTIGVDEMDVISTSCIPNAAPHEPRSTLDMFGTFMLEIDDDDSITVITPDIITIEGASDSMNPPLSFNTMFGFVTRFDDVAGPDGPLSDQSNFDSDSEEKKVTPISSSIELVNFGTHDQPRELRIGTSLSPDDMSKLIDLLRPIKLKLRRLHPQWSLQDGKVRVYVDFQDLNKASPKDDFSLPHIDMLLDSTTGHSMLSFMDGFSGYNQIMMALEDMEKTSYITEWGTYCYRVKVESQEVHLWGNFWKLLGHIVSERGIEVDPEKIRAILDMPAPRTERKIRGFLGRLQYINHFIAKITNICKLIFCLLRKSQPIVWDDDCQHAFKNIKECLFSSLVLVPPTLGRPLLLYIMIERLCLALVWVTRRLRHYVTEYSILLVSRLDPLRYLFYWPILIGRLMTWLVLLTEFDIQYVTQKLVKWSIVTNHLSFLPVFDDIPIDNDFPDEQFLLVTSIVGWQLYFDGAANKPGFGIGILLISPQGDCIPRLVRLAFSDYHRLMNNVVKYEACITSLETTLDLGVRQLEIHGDSNLVI